MEFLDVFLYLVDQSVPHSPAGPADRVCPAALLDLVNLGDPSLLVVLVVLK